jgi:hypothetical protein
VWCDSSDITPGTVFEDPVLEHAADPGATQKELTDCLDRDEAKIGGFRIA